MHVTLLYNAPSLPADHADYAQEAGVLESVEAVEAALAVQIDEVRRRYGAVLVEQFISGRDFNIGMIALPQAEVLRLAEVEHRRREWTRTHYEQCGQC